MAERDDDAELLRLYTDLEAAIEKAIGAAPAAPMPLQGEALQRYLDADAKAVRRIKEIKTTRSPPDLKALEQVTSQEQQERH